eukprot:149403-Chlamydomonas_euryale.AAC.1
MVCANQREKDGRKEKAGLKAGVIGAAMSRRKRYERCQDACRTDHLMTSNTPPKLRDHPPTSKCPILQLIYRHP